MEQPPSLWSRARFALGELFIVPFQPVRVETLREGLRVLVNQRNGWIIRLTPSKRNSGTIGGLPILKPSTQRMWMHGAVLATFTLDRRET